MNSAAKQLTAAGWATDSRVLFGEENPYGGNRAWGRQPQSIKNKVDTVDTMRARLTRLARS